MKQLLLVAVACLLSGCVSVREEQMPATWPELVTLTSADQITGTFRMADRAQVGQVQWIFFPEQKQFPSVEMHLQLTTDKSGLTAEVLRDGTTIFRTVHPAFIESGGLKLSRSKDRIGEFALGTGRATYTFVLRRDLAGGLVIESKSDTAGMGPPFIPVSRSDIRWVRLERLK